MAGHRGMVGHVELSSGSSVMRSHGVLMLDMHDPHPDEGGLLLSKIEPGDLHLLQPFQWDDRRRRCIGGYSTLTSRSKALPKFLPSILHWPAKACHGHTKQFKQSWTLSLPEPTKGNQHIHRFYACVVFLSSCLPPQKGKQRLKGRFTSLPSSHAKFVTGTVEQCLFLATLL